MDFIKEWTYTICITLIISVIFSMLTPKGNMGKFFKIILAAFIFLSFVYPLKSAEIDLSFPDFNISDSEQAQKDSYEDMLSLQIEQKLEEVGYSSCNASCDVELKSDEIYINKVMVSIPDSFDKSEVKNYLFDNLGINAEVYYLGE